MLPQMATPKEPRLSTELMKLLPFPPVARLMQHWRPTVPMAILADTTQYSAKSFSHGVFLYKAHIWNIQYHKKITAPTRAIPNRHPQIIMQ